MSVADAAPPTSPQELLDSARRHGTEPGTRDSNADARASPPCSKSADTAPRQLRRVRPRDRSWRLGEWPLLGIRSWQSRWRTGASESLRRIGGSA